MKVIYIKQLVKEKQEKVKSALINALVIEGLKGDELKEAVRLAMDSKLNDVEEIININEIV